MRKIILALLVVAPSVGLGATLGAMESDGTTEMAGGFEETPWADLERELQDRGVATDTASLIKLADEGDDTDLRWTAVEILGLRKEEEAKPVLRRLVVHEEQRILRETAALALARMGDQQGLEHLRTFLSSTSSPARRAFLAARLAEFGDPSGYPFVLELTESEDTYTRFLSVSALVPFIGLAGSEELSTDPVHELLDLAGDDEAKVRYEVLVQLPSAAREGATLEELVPRVKRMAKEDPAQRVRAKAELLLTLWDVDGS